MDDRKGYVYLLMNDSDTVIYTGVTNDLKKRVYEHKEKLVKGFIAKYNVGKLVYYEVLDSIEEAILREKHIKAGSRTKKLKLIMHTNPEFKDLYDCI